MPWVGREEAGVAGAGYPVPPQPYKVGAGGIEAGPLWLPEVPVGISLPHLPWMHEARPLRS